VRFEDASVRLDGRYVWRHVNLEIEEGEFAAILGPNGAGKTTLVRSALGLVQLAEGSVTVFGRRGRLGNDEVGYLPQRRSFDSDLRIRGVDLVRLGLDGAEWGVPLPFSGLTPGGRMRSRRVEQALRLVGADAFAERPVAEMSGGEQQRVLIAQAIVSRPRMLFLDEPLEGLDLNNQQAIAALLRDISTDEGVTVALVAHDVNPILPHLDRVVYVAQGQVVSGRPEDVIRTETLTRLYGAPVEVLQTSDGRIVVVGQHEPVRYHHHDGG
jgi:zinc/manganese transport system ATP-binding protein